MPAGNIRRRYHEVRSAAASSEGLTAVKRKVADVAVWEKAEKDRYGVFIVSE
jgi:hypothetical protein